MKNIFSPPEFGPWRQWLQLAVFAELTIFGQQTLQPREFEEAAAELLRETLIQMETCKVITI